MGYINKSLKYGQVNMLRAKGYRKDNLFFNSQEVLVLSCMLGKRMNRGSP